MQELLSLRSETTHTHTFLTSLKIIFYDKLRPLYYFSGHGSLFSFEATTNPNEFEARLHVVGCLWWWSPSQINSLNFNCKILLAYPAHAECVYFVKVLYWKFLFLLSFVTTMAIEFLMSVFLDNIEVKRKEYFLIKFIWNYKYGLSVEKILQKLF